MSYELADHLVTPRPGYTHHGLYAGGNDVLEYSQKGVQIVSMAEFSEGYPINVELHYIRCFDRHESVQRGISRLGEDSYNVVFNNCERFVNWCINGIPICSQLEGRIIPLIEKAYKTYIGTNSLPSNALRFLFANPAVANKLFLNLGSNSLIFDVLGAAMTSANIPFLPVSLAAQALGSTAAASTIGASTTAGLVAGAGAGIGAGAAVAGSTIGASTVASIAGGTALAAGAAAAAPVVVGVAAAAVVGYGIKKIADLFD